MRTEEALRDSEARFRGAFDVYAHAPHVQEALRRTLAGEPTSAVVETGGVVLDAHHTPLLDQDRRVRGVMASAPTSRRGCAPRKRCNTKRCTTP